MAQSKSFFGNRRGSTKSHTYQVNGGQQITKDRVDEVKNPRTSAQMVHRCCLHTLSDAHAFLRPFIGRFWEGAQSPAASLAAFRKANYPILRAAANNLTNGFSFSPYKVTTQPLGLFQVASGLPLPSNWILGNFSTANTAAQFRMICSAASTSLNYNDWLVAAGLKVGDRIHGVQRLKVRDQESYFTFAFTLRVLAHENVVVSSLSFDDVFKVEMTYGSNTIQWRLQNGTLFFGVATFNVRLHPNFAYFAYIFERVVNGKTRFSNSFFSCLRPAERGNNFPEAIATYPQGGGNVLDGGPV